MKESSEKAILYLSKNFRKKIKLEEIAKVAGVSSFHFHRKFVEENECTPYEYLENIRMQHATHMMTLFPSWSLIDIAFECGYSSPGIFSRSFKKYYKVAPSKYKPNPDPPIKPSQLSEFKPINIQYLSKKIVAVEKVSLLESKLNIAYQRLINARSTNLIVFGFYLDIPFHIPPEKCRYFIGIESQLSDKDDSVLTIPAGYYTSFTVQGNFNQLEEKAIIMNRQIQDIGYVIDSLVGYEKISIAKNSQQFDYMTMPREIFAKVRRE